MASLAAQAETVRAKGRGQDPGVWEAEAVRAKGRGQDPAVCEAGPNQTQSVGQELDTAAGESDGETASRKDTKNTLNGLRPIILKRPRNWFNCGKRIPRHT